MNKVSKLNGTDEVPDMLLFLIQSSKPQPWTRGFAVAMTTLGHGADIRVAVACAESSLLAPGLPGFLCENVSHPAKKFQSI